MQINFKKISSVITKPRILAPVVFLGIGACKTVIDYKKTKPERKKRVLLKDAGILAGSAAGFALMSPLTKFLCNKYFFNKGILKNTEYVLKQAIAGTLNTFAGVVGAIYANEFMHKYVLNKPYFVPQIKPKEAKKDLDVPEAKNVFKNFIPVDKHKAKSTVNKVFVTISDLPSMKVFHSPMIALTGFSVANTKGYHNKLKKTSYELLANTLIPTMFVSIASIFVNQKKNIIKYPILLGSLAAGSAAGAVVANKYKEEIYDSIDSLDLKHIVV